MFKEDGMFGTLRTLMLGSQARAEEKVRAAYAIELIDQKLREAGQGLNLAKATLASLIQRQRAEQRQIVALEGRLTDLTQRATEALRADRTDLATAAAEAIAAMENELTQRRDTQTRLETRITRLQASVEATHRRMIDLRQSAVSARALRDEQALQTRLNTTLSGQSPMDEAESLITQVLGRDDPYEQSEILSEINRDLNHDTVTARLSEEGFGAPLKASAAEVLARLKSHL
jgi:phage shock protein A